MEVLHNISLRPFNTFGLDASASQFIAVESIDSLREALLLASGRPVLVLGGGSNILLTRDFHGTVIKVELRGMEILSEDEDEVTVGFGAGEEWHQCVMSAIIHGWAGVENMALIPGCIGAAPIQNIGAYGKELKDVFAYLEAMPVDGGEIRRFAKDECEFGYRDSVFKRELKGKYVITKVALCLKKRDFHIDTSYGAIRDELQVMGIAQENAGIADVAEAVMRIRRSKLPDPKEIGNAGSFFKNPEIPREQYDLLLQEYPSIPSYPASEGHVKVPAGWLIEQCGWKGKRLGNHGVHDKQALVLVNYGGAEGAEIFELSSQILESVKAKFGIDLDREVNVV